MLFLSFLCTWFGGALLGHAITKGYYEKQLDIAAAIIVKLSHRRFRSEDDSK